MKRALFVGDGKHDIGGPEWPTGEPFPARGVVPHLAERVAIFDRANSRALRWSDIPRLSASKKGYLHKLRAAQLLAQRHGLDTVVAVVDEDNDPSRRDLIDAARAEASGVPAVMGVAVRSIEAWTLGAVTALAAELRTTATRLRSKYAAPVEQLYEGSQKPELRSKQLLKALADELAHRPDCLELREAVAAATDIDELCHHCPAGFARFVADLRAHFPARPTPAHPTPA